MPLSVSDELLEIPHEWTEIRPDYDGARCSVCGLVASAAEIARLAYGAVLPSCPGRMVDTEVERR